MTGLRKLLTRLIDHALGVVFDPNKFAKLVKICGRSQTVPIDLPPPDVDAAEEPTSRPEICIPLGG